MMWFWIRWVRRLTSAELAADRGVTPSASRNTHAGTCWPVDQTRLCPRIDMLFFCAKATSASALVKLNCPSVGSVELHFMSFPDTRLVKCFVSSCACGPDRSLLSTSAPTGKKFASVWAIEGISVWIWIGGRKLN